MATIEGLKAVRQKLLQLKKKYALKDSVTVGFAQSYALYVHEMKEKNRGKPRAKPARGNYWGPHGQSKFLEEPARTLSASGELGRVAKAVLNHGGSIAMALKAIGTTLQAAAQERVPIDTGALKTSAFTSYTKKADAAIAAAYQKSEGIRQAAMDKR